MNNLNALPVLSFTFLDLCLIHPRFPGKLSFPLNDSHKKAPR